MPLSPVKISHKKDGRQRRLHRFHVSRPPHLATGSTTVYGYQGIFSDYLKLVFTKGIARGEYQIFSRPMSGHIPSICKNSTGVMILFHGLCFTDTTLVSIKQHWHL